MFPNWFLRTEFYFEQHMPRSVIYNDIDFIEVIRFGQGDVRAVPTP